MGWLSSAFNKVLGGVGGIVNKVTGNTEAFEQSKDFQKSMYNKQLQDQWNFFNATNEYNSPAATKQRLMDADYSPQLQFMSPGTSGPASQPTAPGTHGAQAGSEGPGALLNLIPFFSQAAKNKAEINQINAETDFIDTKKLNSMFDRLLTAAKTKNLGKQDEKIDQEIKNLIGSLTQIQLQNDITKHDRDTLINSPNTTSKDPWYARSIHKTFGPHADKIVPLLSLLVPGLGVAGAVHKTGKTILNARKITKAAKLKEKVKGLSFPKFSFRRGK